MLLCIVNIQESDMMFRLPQIYLTADPLGSVHPLTSP